MKRILLVLIVWTSFISFLRGQEVVAKTNLLYDATTTLNLGMEIGLSKVWSLDVSGNYNGWAFGSNHRFRQYMIQPEVRYWLCEKFNGHFGGFHGVFGEYNIGGMKLFGMKNHRYEGWMTGVGLSYGYHWMLSGRWSLETTVGVGYLRLGYDKYPCADCGSLLDTGHSNYWGPTKVGVSLIYIIK